MKRDVELLFRFGVFATFSTDTFVTIKKLIHAPRKEAVYILSLKLPVETQYINYEYYMMHRSIMIVQKKKPHRFKKKYTRHTVTKQSNHSLFSSTGPVPGSL
mmetsp:Transcript_32233/g.46981  ORF Transcript_32233/g.46981 Transcript_32233/m.46981 type:complete len:102 (-) Transcript_32233:537-842(-)